MKKTQLIVALDVEKLKDAEALVELLYPTVGLFKIGSQLFTACGPEAVKMVGSKKAQVFLDLKFFDIPNTVYSAVASGTSSSIAISYISTGFNESKMEDQVKEAVRLFPVFMMTVHTSGGEEMMRSAAQAAKVKAEELKRHKPLIVGVTVLTSDKGGAHIEKRVIDLALSAKNAGLDGIVCSVEEAAAVRKTCGQDFIIVTPGIRPQGAQAGDQKRVATPAAAIAAGSDFLVVGRPIVEAKDPPAAAKDILKEIYKR